MRKSLLRAASLNVVSQLFNGVGAVISSVIVARCLGPAQTGNYSLAAFTVLTIGQLAALGGPLVITRAVAEDNLRAMPFGTANLIRLSVRWSALSVAGAVGIGGLAVATGLADRFIGTEQLLIGGTLVAYVATAYGSALLAGRQEFRRLLLISASGTALQIVGATLVAVLAPSISAFLTALLIGLVFQAALLWRIASSWRQEGSTPSGAERSSLRRDVILISSISVLDTVVLQRTEVFALAALSTNRQVAYFSLASALVTRSMAFLPGAVASVLLPRFSASSDMRGEYSVSMRWCALASVPLAGWFIAAGSLIVDTMYGPSFHGLTPVVVVVAVAAVVTGFGAVGGSAAYATRNHPRILVVQAACAVLNVVLALLLCARYGALGAAYAGSIAQVLGVVVGIRFLQRAANLHPPWSPILRTIIAGGVAVAAGLVTRSMVEAALPPPIALGAVSASFFATFAALIIIAQAVPRDEIAAAWAVVRTVFLSLTARRWFSAKVRVP
jgi:O-antigen/teichoic acid export membrane protein